MSTVSNSVNSVNSFNSVNSVHFVNSVNSVNRYSAVLPPSPMVFFDFPFRSYSCFRKKI